MVRKSSLSGKQYAYTTTYRPCINYSWFYLHLTIILYTFSSTFLQTLELHPATSCTPILIDVNNSNSNKYN